MPKPAKLDETPRYIVTGIALTEPLDVLVDILSSMHDIVQHRIRLEGWTPDTTTESPRVAAPVGPATPGVAPAKAPGRRRGRPPKPAADPAPAAVSGEAASATPTVAAPVAVPPAAVPGTPATVQAPPSTEPQTPMPGLGQPATGAVGPPVVGGRASN